MKKIIIAALLPCSVFFANAAMADHQPDHHQTHKNNSAALKHSSNQWRSGQVFPNNYRSSSYAVDYRKYRQLSKPSRGQQWYKVKNDYVLVNAKDYRILRVL